MPVMVLIADGDAAGRAMARRTIEGVVQVVGEATNDEEAMRLAQDLMPDVILIDIDLPRGGGVPFTHRLKALQPRIKVILTTGHEEERYLSATGRSGADALLPKKSIKAEALSVIRGVTGDMLRRWDGRERRRAAAPWNGIERRTFR
jgi:DNA-binding NarL/FixJ family response regulator